MKRTGLGVGSGSERAAPTPGAPTGARGQTRVRPWLVALLLMAMAAWAPASGPCLARNKVLDRQVELIREARELMDRAFDSGDFDLYLEAHKRLRQVFETLRYVTEGEPMIAGHILLGLLYAGMKDRYTGLGFDPALWAVMGRAEPSPAGDPGSRPEPEAADAAPEPPWTPASMAAECFEFAAGNLGSVAEEHRYPYYFLLAAGYDRLSILAPDRADFAARQALLHKSNYFLARAQRSARPDPGPGRPGSPWALDGPQGSDSPATAAEIKALLEPLARVLADPEEAGNQLRAWVDSQLESGPEAQGYND